MPFTASSCEREFYLCTAMALNPASSDQRPTRFVLVNASHAGNVGAAARAIKVMGFHDLVLVAPRDAGVLQQPQARAMASGAGDVLARARVVHTLAAALDGMQLVCATAMTPRDFGPPAFAPRARLPALAAQGASVAFVFGGERFGLANDDVYRCHACLSIPTAPGYGSLNLAQAVQLVAYEWRQALGSFCVQPRTPLPDLADAAEVQAALAHWQQVLCDIGFLDPAVPKRLMPRLNQLLNRAQLRREELHILRGIARAAGREDG
jgi:tRNA/rRNA methyltransferase